MACPTDRFEERLNRCGESPQCSQSLSSGAEWKASVLFDSSEKLLSKRMMCSWDRKSLRISSHNASISAI